MHGAEKSVRARRQTQNECCTATEQKCYFRQNVLEGGDVVESGGKFQNIPETFGEYFVLDRSRSVWKVLEVAGKCCIVVLRLLMQYM